MIELNLVDGLLPGRVNSAICRHFIRFGSLEQVKPILEKLLFPSQLPAAVRTDRLVKLAAEM